MTARYIEHNDPVYATALAGGGTEYISSSDAETHLVGQLLDAGVYYIQETFLSFDTTGVLATPATVTLTLGVGFSSFSHPVDIHVAVYDWGASIGSGDWRNGTQLAALTPVGTISSDDIPGSGTFDIDIDPSAISLGGTTRFVIYSAESASATAPSGDDTLGLDGDGGSNPPSLTVVESEPEPEAPVVGCYDVNLNGFLLDSATEDADGLTWTVNDMEGWFNGAPTEVSTSAGANEIEQVNSAKRRARAFTLKGTAQHPNGISIESLYWKAQRRLKAATQPLARAELMIVEEPDITLQALVRLAAGNPYRFRPKVGNGIAVLEFEIDLFAPDWRRYGEEHTQTVSNTGTDTSSSATFANAGDAPTAPVVTIDGPAVNPGIHNESLFGDPEVRWAGTLGGGDSLVIDMAQRTVILNGTDDERGQLSMSEWWMLRPGNNTVTVRRSSGSGTQGAELVWRDAYT